MAIYNHHLYVVARRDDRDAPFLIRFSRVDDVHRGGEKFKYPRRTRYDPSELFAQSIGVFISDDHPIETVVLRLAPRWSYYAETHCWHPGQQVVADDDGHVVVRIRARLCPELKGWVLGFGPDAEVLSPQTLREQVRNDVQRMSSVYQ